MAARTVSCGVGLAAVLAALLLINVTGSWAVEARINPGKASDSVCDTSSLRLESIEALPLLRVTRETEVGVHRKNPPIFSLFVPSGSKLEALC